MIRSRRTIISYNFYALEMVSGRASDARCIVIPPSRSQKVPIKWGLPACPSVRLTVRAFSWNLIIRRG